PFASEQLKSQTVIGFRYPRGVEDKKFRASLSEKFGVLIAGGFGKLKGQMFRVGSMGEINEQSVTRTVSAIAQSFKLNGYDCDASKALETSWNSFHRLEAAQRF